ncbi:MAG: PAS domain-containing protein [Comamonadaceae bacterium]|nr:PAS domain-containing protein [Comamonadaceae bacterium]
MPSGPRASGGRRDERAPFVFRLVAGAARRAARRGRRRRCCGSTRAACCASCNQAALRLGLRARRRSRASWRRRSGVDATRWLDRAFAPGGPRGDAAAPAPTARTLRLSARPLAGGALAARAAASRRRSRRARRSRCDAARTTDEARRAVALLWSTPFPATLQDEHFRILDANDAFVELTGHPRASLIGRDPAELQPPEDDRGERRRPRARLLAALAAGVSLPALPARPARRARRPALVHAACRRARPGRRAAAVAGRLAGRRPPSICAQMHARPRAGRARCAGSTSARPACWSTTSAGLVRDAPTRRSRRWSARVPVRAGRGADPALQALLGWDGGAPDAALVSRRRSRSSARPLVPLPGGGRRRLRARASPAGRPAQGQRRVHGRRRGPQRRGASAISRGSRSAC